MPKALVPHTPSQREKSAIALLYKSYRNAGIRLIFKPWYRVRERIRGSAPPLSPCQTFRRPTPPRHYLRFRRTTPCKPADLDMDISVERLRESCRPRPINNFI